MPVDIKGQGKSSEENVNTKKNDLVPPPWQ